MYVAPQSPFRVDAPDSFRLADWAHAPPADAPGKKACGAALDAAVARIDQLQRRLYAENRQSLLLVFQALDAAGKDGTIRAVTTGVNPAGVQVHSFKAPSAEELDHDFLWRTTCRLPERGRIGIFNRSYYEEVLVVRVHPELLAHARLPDPVDLDTLWAERCASIRDHELHLARQGTRILKFMLHVGAEEQGRRLRRRLDDPDRNWKFEEGDLVARERRADYLAAYEDAIRRTSRPHAPWYVVPADDKPFLRATVAGIVADALDAMNPRTPAADPALLGRLDALRARLDADAD
jgi:PPK2 family polyphosphate:nucleotide phosphotransferase